MNPLYKYETKIYQGNLTQLYNKRLKNYKFWLSRLIIAVKV